MTTRIVLLAALLSSVLAGCGGACTPDGTWSSAVLCGGGGVGDGSGDIAPIGPRFDVHPLFLEGDVGAGLAPFETDVLGDGVWIDDEGRETNPYLFGTDRDGNRIEVFIGTAGARIGELAVGARIDAGWTGRVHVWTGREALDAVAERVIVEVADRHGATTTLFVRLELADEAGAARFVRVILEVSV